MKQLASPLAGEAGQALAWPGEGDEMAGPAWQVRRARRACPSRVPSHPNPLDGQDSGDYLGFAQAVQSPLGLRPLWPKIAPFGPGNPQSTMEFHDQFADRLFRQVLRLSASS